jgi:hypothetical protein
MPVMATGPVLGRDSAATDAPVATPLPTGTVVTTVANNMAKRCLRPMA